MIMIARPTERWRRETATQQAAVDAGGLTAEEAWAPALWPPDFTAAVDRALDAFDDEVADLSADSADDAAWTAVERVVLALNAADEEGHIETGEREELCDYIDRALASAGIDVNGLTARRGVDRSELTDEWRDW
ncbi:hypothetical protein Aab01nite_39180 [Paractinoplanes abujensis]|uniref:Nucleotide-binding universal stress UspA family protein n=1 Tax=Paractinoplanes abujensis TaxID=882441 RepID=A0A7W7CU52_9ACTN|nr:hypothetical protein [Actinoplanes abujensis]MBB4694459.1 nucleotide-binding universal stress UspA family protein [Actinoplanes abujensis]GID20328.1 hypothetical protein Aab01nite_39180 [Actinoplanes abujensis]